MYEPQAFPTFAHSPQSPSRATHKAMHPIPLVAIDGEQKQPTFYNMVGAALALSLSAAFHRNGLVNWDSPRQKAKVSVHMWSILSQSYLLNYERNLEELKCEGVNFSRLFG